MHHRGLGILTNYMYKIMLIFKHHLITNAQQHTAITLVPLQHKIGCSSSIQTITVGTVIETVQPVALATGSRTIPPIGNFTLPRRTFSQQKYSFFREMNDYCEFINSLN
jgi:hypothetical protein